MTTTETTTAPVEPTTTEEIFEPVFVCPACGLIHDPNDFASLDPDCQIACAVIPVSDLKIPVPILDEEKIPVTD